MMIEWKRLLLNKKLLFTAVLLLVVNILLFLHISLDGDIVSTKASTDKRMEVLRSYQTGAVTVQDLEDQLANADIILRFFSYRFMSQEHPDEYVRYWQAEETALRSEYPEVAAEFDRGDYKETETRQWQTALNTVFDSVAYSADYQDSLVRIQSNAQKLSEISVFRNSDGTAAHNIQKTAEDYAGLKDVSITPGNDASTIRLMEYNFLPLIGVLFSVLLVSLTFEEQKYGLRVLIFSCENGRGTLTAWRAAGVLLGSILFSLLLYGSTMLVDIHLFGTVDFRRMAQSVPMLFGITTPITLGKLWMLYIVTGILVQLMITALIWCLFSIFEHRAIAITLLAGILGGALLLYRIIPNQSVVAFFKYANLAAVMDFGRLLCTYHNVYLGPVLMEKNWLVVGMMVLTFAVTFAAAVWCGIRRYGIPSHGRVYRAFQNLFKILSCWYHKGVSHLPFMGIEAYKVLIVNRGSIVLLVLVIILAQEYQPKEPIYAGKAQFMQAFYENYANKDIGGDVLEYIDKLQANLAQVEAEWLTAMEYYQSGEISAQEYELELRKYEAYDIQRQGLEQIQSEVTYIQQQEERGYTAALVDSTGYHYLLEDTSMTGRIMDWISIFALIVLCAGIYPAEKKTGLHSVLYSTSNGRGWLSLRKSILGIVFSGVVYALFTGM